MTAATGRVLVTGHSPSGEAVLVSDTVAPTIALAGVAVSMRSLWGRDGVPRYPDDGTVVGELSPMPPPGGCRVTTLTLEPGEDAAYHAFIRSALGKMADPIAPGFHRTPTLDIVTVLEGELRLELDGGEHRLAAGDTTILNGVRHRWSNPSSGRATLLAVQLGAEVRPAAPETRPASGAQTSETILPPSTTSSCPLT